MDEKSFIVDAIWSTIWGLGYFVCIFTSDRNLEEYRGEYSDEVAEKLQRKGPISLFNQKVIINTIWFTCPLWLYNQLKDSHVYPYLIYLSVGCFLSPLIITTKMPGAKDATDTLTFTGKWLIAKLDAYIKITLLGFICHLLFLIPIIHTIGTKVSSAIFPVISKQQSTQYFEEIVTATFLAFVISHFVRLSTLVIHGLLLPTIYGICIAFIWMQLQWNVNNLLPIVSSQTFLKMSLFTTLYFDLFQDFTIAMLDRRIISKK